MEAVEIKKAIAEMAQKDLKSYAEMLIEYATPGHISSDWMNLLLESKSLKRGDMLQKKVRKGIKVHTHVPGAIPLKHEITVSDRIMYSMDMAEVSVTAGRYELESGEIGTVESISAEMQAKLRDYLMNKVFTSLSTIWTTANTPDNYIAVGGSLTTVALDAALETIANTAGGAKAIVGTRAALQPVMGNLIQFVTNAGTTYFIEGIGEELRRSGWLGTYKGVPVLIVPQEWDSPDTHNALIPTDKVLVVGNKVGSFVSYGDVQSQEYVNMEVVPWQWNLTLFTEFGFIIDNADGIVVIGGLS